MRSFSYACLSGLLLFASGCCRPNYRPSQSRPMQSHGWESRAKGRLLTIGSFVLGIGESTENNRLGVTLLSLEPGKICYSPIPTESTTDKIKLRFYRPSDRRILCETTIFAYGGSVSGNLACPPDPDLPPSIYLPSYNVKAGWIWLELTTTVGFW